jgi:ribosomal protein S18 acetylase RimI-like enzyme
MTAGVRRATEADRATVIELVFEGFKDDPSTRWSLPEDRYEERLRNEIEFDVDEALAAGEVWLTRGLESVAWWSPAATRDERRREVLDYFERGGNPFGEKLDAVRAAELAIVDELPAEGKFRYLEALATRTDARRRGHARAVVQPGLERAEREGVAAVLDADDRGVIAFYEKVGFARMAEVRLPDTPTAWVMVRRPPG